MNDYERKTKNAAYKIGKVVRSPPPGFTFVFKSSAMKNKDKMSDWMDQ